MTRSINKVQLLGNLTRDPELKYTPQGTAVCTFSIATNRQWKTESGDTKDEAEFHRIVAWDKLAEICANLLKKGSRALVEGRIQTRKWEDKDGNQKTTTEIVISEMLLLDNKGDSASSESFDIPNQTADIAVDEPSSDKANQDKANEETDDDIPF